MKETKKYTWKYLDEAGFETIKTLVNLGLSDKNISGIVGKSVGTIHKVKKAKDLASYKQAQIESRAKYVNGGVKPAPASPAAYPMPLAETNFDFKLLNENLVLLANKLEGYAKATEGLTIATYALRKQNQTEPAAKKRFF